MPELHLKTEIGATVNRRLRASVRGSHQAAKLQNWQWAVSLFACQARSRTLHRLRWISWLGQLQSVSAESPSLKPAADRPGFGQVSGLSGQPLTVRLEHRILADHVQLGPRRYAADDALNILFSGAGIATIDDDPPVPLYC